MSAQRGFFPAGLVQAHPGLGILRMAAMLAAEGGMLDDETVSAMSGLVEAGALARTAPADMWPELARGLMARAPSRMIVALRASGALAAVLPEVAALFGVPQSSADQTSVDIGLHLQDALAEAAACNAPLAVRFALLTMNVGKSDSPPEHLPVHYRHVERGAPRIEAICARFGVPAPGRALALLALAECERVHRVSPTRAGPIAAMLERLGAFDTPAQFELLMTVCSCDYRAHRGRSGRTYPKAALLTAALQACRGADAADDLQMARAVAIARAFGSQRWSREQS